MRALRFFLKKHYILSNAIVFTVGILLVYLTFVKDNEINEHEINKHIRKKRILISIRRFYIGMITAFVIPLLVNYLSSDNIWNKKNADNIYNMASELYENGEYSAALIQCDKLIELDPYDPQYHLLKGNVFFKLMQYDRAYKNYSEAKKINPNEALYYAKCGLSLIYGGRITEGINEMDTALNIEPENSTILHQYGKALQEAGMYKEASEKYKHAIDIDRNNMYENYILIGDYAKSLYYIEDYKTAMELYAKLYEKNESEIFYELFLLSRYKLNGERNDDPNFHNQMGQALEYIGKYHDALGEYNTALEIAPDGPVYFLANLVDRLITGEAQ